MKTKHYIIICVVGLALFIVLSLFLSLVLSLLLAALVCVALYFVFRSSAKDTNSRDEDIDEAPPMSDEQKGVEALLAINLQLRKSIVPSAIRDSFEQVIDQLMSVLPEVNKVSPGGELAWVINRMSTEYLPEKSIRPYLSLDEAMRHDQATMDEVEMALSGMKGELAEVQDILARHKTNEFSNKAKFLKQRFGVE